MIRSIFTTGIVMGILTGTVACAAAVETGSVCPPLSLAPLALPPGSEGIPYSYRIASYGGEPPVRLLVGSGSFPPGLAISPDGALSGTPTASGTFEFTLVANDSCPTGQQRVSRPLKVVIGAEAQPSVIKQQQLRVAVKATPAVIAVDGLKPAAQKIAYALTAQPAGTATLHSPGATFAVAGAVVESVAEPMTIAIINGSATVAEVVAIPKRVLDTARREKAKIIYSRSFSGRQTTAVAVVDFTLD
jgi:hypothetical protein